MGALGGVVADVAREGDVGVVDGVFLGLQYTYVLIQELCRAKPEDGPGQVDWA